MKTLKFIMMMLAVGQIGQIQAYYKFIEKIKPKKITPFVSIEAGYRKLPWQDLYGDDHFSNHYIQYSPAVGVSLDDISVSAGRSVTNTGRHTRLYNRDSELVLGCPTGAGVNPDFIMARSSAKLKSSLLDFKYSYEVKFKTFKPKVVFLLGTVKSKLHLTTQRWATDDPAGAGSQYEPLRILDSKNKHYTRFGLGFLIPINKNMAMNFSLIKERTKKLMLNAIGHTVQDPSEFEGQYTIHAKNSKIFSIGLQISIF